MRFIRELLNAEVNTLRMECATCDMIEGEATSTCSKCIFGDLADNEELYFNDLMISPCNRLEQIGAR